MNEPPVIIVELDRSEQRDRYFLRSGQQYWTGSDWSYESYQARCFDSERDARCTAHYLARVRLHEARSMPRPQLLYEQRKASLNLALAHEATRKFWLDLEMHNTWDDCCRLLNELQQLSSLFKPCPQFPTIFDEFMPVYAAARTTELAGIICLLEYEIHVRLSPRAPGR